MATLAERRDRIIKKQRDEFIRIRTIVETEWNKFVNTNAKAPESVKKAVACPYEDITDIKKILPSLYAERFNNEQYKREYAVMASYLTQWKKLVDETNESILKLVMECEKSCIK